MAEQNSKAKPVSIILIVAVIAAVAIGFFTWRSHQQQKQLEDARQPSQTEPAQTPVQVPQSGSPSPSATSTEEVPEQAEGVDAKTQKDASAVVTKFVPAFLTYGYPDKHAYDYLNRAKPYMTPSMYAEWMKQAKEAGDDDPTFTQLKGQKRRHVTEVDGAKVTKVDGNKATAMANFRSSDLASKQVKDGVPQDQPEQKIMVMLIKVDGSWLVSGEQIEQGQDDVP